MKTLILSIIFFVMMFVGCDNYEQPIIENKIQLNQYEVWLMGDVNQYWLVIDINQECFTKALTLQEAEYLISCGMELHLNQYEVWLMGDVNQYWLLNMGNR